VVRALKLKKEHWMFNPRPQTRFNLTESVFKPPSFTHQKSFSAPSCFDLEQVSGRPDLTIESPRPQVLDKDLASKKGVCLIEGTAV
jgi:hypothetical protein